ncbi:MAG: hypothetical protein RL419_966 [Actinomycetota bacterium]|jgi:UDPglucose 6-dehydrogenase
MRVSVFGAGYVGLVTATCLASVGHSVICVDVDRRRIAELGRGEPGFYEPNLRDLMSRCLADGSLRFSSSPEHAVRNSLVHIVAVGTPSQPDGSADVSQVLAVGNTIGKHLTKFGVVVVKSTVPVGTNERVESAVADGLQEREELVQFAVASNPEFLREGKAVEDFLKPDRVVVGARHQRAFNILEEMYRPITSVHGDFLKMSIRSAELAKYACNSMLATRVSFMNEFAELADTVGADILDVARVMGSDQRIGPHFLNAGVGFGGSCFPKDLKATIHLASSVGRSMPILSSVCQVNDFQHLTLIERAKSLLGDLNGKRIAIWGLSFKPETDDIREAPSVSVIRRLLMQGASVRAHDPKVRWLPLLSSMDQSSFSIHDDKLEAAEGSDVLMLITEWNEYRDVDLGIVTGLMRTPIVLDGRNLWSEKLHDSDKYSYFGVGRGESATHHSSQRELAG